MTLRPELQALRSEYEDLCIARNSKPSACLEPDEALGVLEAACMDANSSLAVYARTAKSAVNLFPKAFKEKRSIREHPTLPLAYGAKVAGYVDLVASIYESKGWTFSTPIYVDEMPINSFNGKSFATQKSRGALCMLDYGLFRLLHHISLAVYLISNARESEDSIKPYLANPHLRSRAAGIVRETVNAYLMTGSQELILPADKWLDEGGFMAANALSFAMKLFVVAHEISHVRLGHVERALSGAKREEMLQMEYEADIEAQETLILVAEKTSPEIPVLGGGLAFLLVDLIRNNLFLALHNIRPEILSKGGDHPPSLDRIKRMDTRLGAYFRSNPVVSRETLAPVKLLQWVASDLQSAMP